MGTTAKLVQRGRYQFVELPRDCWFAADEVCIKRVGSAVMLYAKGSPYDILSSAARKAERDSMRERDEPPGAKKHGSSRRGKGRKQP